MIVLVKNLTHRYGSRTALSDVSFHVEEGEIFGILGPNGGGKSTLFRILSTLMAPESGQVVVSGFALDRQPREVRRQIGVVFQTQSLDRKLTVLENMNSQGRLFGMSGFPLHKRVDEALDRLGLADRRNDMVGTLSGGLRRRVEIAKALLHRPAVLLMDEPTTGLDPAARRELWRFLEDLRAQYSLTILVTTHILEEAERSNRLILLHEGRIVAQGTPAELKAKVGGDVVVLGVTDPERARRQLAEQFRIEPQAVDGTLRIETADGRRLMAEVLEAMPGMIQSIAMHRPTLEEVFLNETGVTLDA